MKIVIITPYFYPRMGGVEKYVFNIARGLKKNYKFNVVIITSRKGVKITKSIEDGILIYRIPTLFYLSNTPINLFWYSILYNILKTEKPNLVNAHTPVPYLSDIASLVCKKLDIPFVLSYHNDLIKDALFYKPIFWMYYKFAEQFTFKSSRTIIATSQYYVKNSKYINRFSKKIEIISPGVDIDTFKPTVKPINIKSISKNAPVVLFVGQLDKTHLHKGIINLIKAMVFVKKNFPDAHLVIIGKGNNIEYLKKVCKNLNLTNNVIFTGYVTENEISSYYSRASLVVLPSTNNSEGFGMVLLEAAAMGKAAIGTKVGGIPSIIFDKKTGLLIEPNNIDMLSNAIIHLLSNTNLRNKIALNALKNIKKNYTWEIQIKKTNNIFSKII